MNAIETDRRRHRGTKSSAIYRHSAQDLVDRLRDLRDPKARPLLEEATRLLGEFDRWNDERPTPEARDVALAALYSVNERAVVLLAKQTDYWVRRRRGV